MGRLAPYQCESSYVPCSETRCPALSDTGSRDFQLIERFQAGDLRVFDRLYRRYQDCIHGVDHRVISNPDVALDISQDVFLKAYQALGDFKIASQFSSWLYRITINRCIDFMGRGAKHRAIRSNPISNEEFFLWLARRQSKCH